MGELTNEKTAVNFVRLINFLDQLVTLTQFAQYLKNSSYYSGKDFKLSFNMTK